MKACVFGEIKLEDGSAIPLYDSVIYYKLNSLLNFYRVFNIPKDIIYDEFNALASIAHFKILCQADKIYLWLIEHGYIKSLLTSSGVFGGVALTDLGVAFLTLHDL